MPTEPAQLQDCWTLNLAPWIIQDGNYPDFVTGQEAEFALEFYSEAGYERVATKSRAADHITDDRYALTAEITAIAQDSGDDVWIADFGLRGYCPHGVIPDCSVGDFVHGEATIGIDCFLYFETLARKPLVPELVYTWKIREIVKVSSPCRLEEKGWIPDRSKASTELVERTDAWADDPFTPKTSQPVSVGYLMECELQDVPPKRTSATAI